MSFSTILLPWLILPFFFTVQSADLEFRVDGEVRIGDKTSAVKNTVYFLNRNEFISLIDKNGEITHYKKDGETEIFTLIAPDMRIRTQLDAKRVKTDVDNERKRHASHSDPFFAFVAKPTFQSEFDPASGDLSLQSPWFDYTIKTEIFPNKGIMEYYMNFCDLSCYLNFQLNRLPSYLVRLEVNRLLRENNRFPKMIEMSFFPKGKGLFQKDEKARSSHVIITRLDESDRKRIQEVFEFMRQFPVVRFEDYQKRIVDNKKTR